MGKTTVDGLDKAVGDAFDLFYGACITDIQEAAKVAAKQAAKDLRAKSPIGTRPTRSPRVTASRATPVPVAPPPITRMSRGLAEVEPMSDDC